MTNEYFKILHKLLHTYIHTYTHTYIHTYIHICPEFRTQIRDRSFVNRVLDTFSLQLSHVLQPPLKERRGKKVDLGNYHPSIHAAFQWGFGITLCNKLSLLTATHFGALQKKHIIFYQWNSLLTPLAGLASLRLPHLVSFWEYNE